MISELQIRRLCRDILRARYKALHRHELGVLHGANRADLAFLSPTELVGAEVKSDQDALTRLPGQVEAFSKVFDRVELFTGPKYAAKAGVPSWWGLWVVKETETGLVTEHLRPSEPNPGVSTRDVAMLMWRDELKAFLRAQGQKGLSKNPVDALLDRVKELPLDLVRAEVRRCLCNRWVTQGGFKRPTGFKPFTPPTVIGHA